MSENSFFDFDHPDKRAWWHTAFYYYAEHVRILTGGTINHKKLYALIGLHARYINHANPTIRKRTAAALSRIVHSEQYVDDFSASFEADPSIFDHAASVIADDILATGAYPLEFCIDHVRGPFWADIVRGLSNEQKTWRAEVNLLRVKNEGQMLLANDDAMAFVPTPAGLVARMRSLLKAYLHIVVFGHLDERQIDELVSETPFEARADFEMGEQPLSSHACLVRFSGPIVRSVSRLWLVDAAQRFTIGRFTDCDAIDPCPLASRMHGTIFMHDGLWFYQDCASLHGSRVMRGDELVIDTKIDAGASCCELRYGDVIVIADTSHYWFVGVCGVVSTVHTSSLG